jgi:cyclopropane fatty-acyl-phospholipid synthase-like methyltransferase
MYCVNTKAQEVYMPDKPYYLAYEERYQKVFKAGGDCWGHGTDDETLAATLKKWVNDNQLKGKKIIEFACGEGASGVLLSRLGCLYHGVDISSSVVQKAKELLLDFPAARVSKLDMVKETIGEVYDAALDCMGFHMLVTDSDRAAYLRNAYNSFKSGASMLFFRETYRCEVYNGNVESLEQWI